MDESLWAITNQALLRMLSEQLKTAWQHHPERKALFIPMHLNGLGYERKEYTMMNFLNQFTYNYFLIGILGLLVGWLISKLLVNKHWGKRYKKLEDENNSYLTRLDESGARTRSYDKVVKKLSSRLALIHSDNRTLVKAFTKLQTRRNTLESKLDSSASLFKRVKKDNIELQDKNISLVDKLDIAVKEQHSFKELEKLTVDLKTSNSDLQQKLTRSESNNQETNAALNNLKAKHDEFLEEYRLLQDEKNSQPIARTQSKTEETKQFEQLNEKINELSSERDQLIVNAEKHTIGTTDIKTLKDKVIALEKEEKRLTAETLQQKQELSTFVDLQTKFESLEIQNKILIKGRNREKHHSKNMLRKNDKLQNAIFIHEKKLNETTYQKNTTALEEIKRHEDYLLKSETRWASKLNTLDLKIKSERTKHLKALQQSNNETQATHSKLAAMSAKLEKTEADLRKLNTEKTEFQEKKRKEARITTKTATNHVAKTVSKTLSDTKKPTNLNLNSELNRDQKNKQTVNDLTPSTSNLLKSTTTKKTANTNTHQGRPKTRYPIDTIRGIGVVYSKRLRRIKIEHVDTLLSKGNTPAGRKSLSSRTDIDEELIATWVGQADLLQVDGIDGEYAELLEATGISNTTALRNSDITSLTKKLIDVNKKHEVALKKPTMSIVSGWITNATKLSKTLKYDNDTNADTNTDTGFTVKAKVKNKLKTKVKTKLKTKINSKLNKEDQLTKIKGIGKVNEKLLHSLGIKTIAQIAKFTKQDEIEIGEKLSSYHNRISKENWVKQATELLRNQDLNKN